MVPAEADSRDKVYLLDESVTKDKAVSQDDTASQAATTSWMR
jgi:hypothetical protein